MQALHNAVFIKIMYVNVMLSIIHVSIPHVVIIVIILFNARNSASMAALLLYPLALLLLISACFRMLAKIWGYSHVLACVGWLYFYFFMFWVTKD